MKSDDVVLLFKHYNERSSSPTTSQLRHICRLQLTWTNMNPLQGRAFSITPSKVGQFSKFFLTSWLTHLYCTVSVTHRALPKGQRSGKFDDVSCCTAAACCLHRCLYHTRYWSGLFTTDNWSLSRDLWPGPCGLFFLTLKAEVCTGMNSPVQTRIPLNVSYDANMTSARY